MKNYFFSAIILIQLHEFSVNAQLYEKKIIESGHPISEYTSYLFPSFADAVVKLKDGQQLVSKMNFNLLLSQMQFINPNGDTLNVAKTENIESIQLHDNLFFYNNGYVQVFASVDSIKLAVLRNVSYEPVKIGGLGIASHAQGIQTYTSLVDVYGTKQLVMNEDIDVINKSTYFLVTGTGEMVGANKSNFLKLFVKDKQRIENYLKLNKINFNKEEDLKKLLASCIETSAPGSGSK